MRLRPLPLLYRRCDSFWVSTSVHTKSNAIHGCVKQSCICSRCGRLLVCQTPVWQSTDHVATSGTCSIVAPLVLSNCFAAKVGDLASQFAARHRCLQEVREASRPEIPLARVATRAGKPRSLGRHYSTCRDGLQRCASDVCCALIHHGHRHESPHIIIGHADKARAQAVKAAAVY